MCTNLATNLNTNINLQQITYCCILQANCVLTTKFFLFQQYVANYRIHFKQQQNLKISLWRFPFTQNEYRKFRKNFVKTKNKCFSLYANTYYKF